MAISRTWYNTLVDDDGSGLSGTVIDKADFGALLDAIDALVVLRSSWTPALEFGGSASGIAYTTQTGTYSRIGDVVFVEWRIVLSSKGAQTGAATILNLPVTSLGYPNGAIYYAGMSGLTGAMTVRASTGTTLYLMQHGAAALAEVTDANFTNTSDIRGSLIYLV